ncbi:TrkH family potassium uptake protein [Helcobacillus massiliensis]|uniref:Trk-type K+ transport system membrane component n=1 Tax=Helcobacillus massiliensis TaxID=521392 RepID=A0A839QYI1_9MICO|nr:MULTISPECIES: potassium transporter TrkG [Helcobacillus]MBB3023011.1 Trk-type K+ transport system membrane component [Helcobacillus massiliensis]MCG7427969.1 TrkH family potassium uptake protein [Helcobacillus sp. ACRRO]MCT1558408.1 TrkH family potassium uptake protein [Helcobacillus massiliensis]MCT2036820.1 TrkH family potassium uptake protein [Helcobacillus massiliensis]MCT2332601.1 TrkH family potassium uptake protein [Helcobacillus massiliensis]
MQKAAKSRGSKSALGRIVQNAARTRTSPARLAMIAFLGIIGLVTLLLWLPISNADGTSPPLIDALFTAVSAVCVTGLTTLDMAHQWSLFGNIVIMAAMKVGGFGVLTVASLLGLSVMREMGLAQRIVTARETKAQQLDQVGGVLKTIVITSTALETLTFLSLAPFFLSRGASVPTALFDALYYGISSFNNVGFVHEAEGTLQYVGEPAFVLPVAAAVFTGSLGFPVILVLFRHWNHPAKWTLHAKMTIAGSTLLLLLAIVSITALEWTNPDTFGGLPLKDRMLAALFTGVMPRSGGLSVIDVGAMHPESWVVQDLLMFIGGGSGSTAGGIKVTTFAILMLAIIAEVRGDRDVEAFGRRIPEDTIRQAIGVLAISVMVIFFATLVMLRLTPYGLDQVLFEVLSAYGTVGLSTGITADLSTPAKAAIVTCMLVGRLGPVTVGAALAMRTRPRIIRLPEERPIIG